MFNHRKNKDYTERDCPNHGVYRLTGGAENGGNSIRNRSGVFRNESATLQESLQTQNFLNNNNNNQFLPKRSNFPRLADGAKNLELENCLRLPDGPSDFRTKVRRGNFEMGPFRKNRSNKGCLFMVNGSTGAPNGVSSFGSQIQPVLAPEGSQNPYSEPNNNVFQSQTIESQSEMNMKDYLNKSYIEDSDFICDFDTLQQ